MTNKKYELNINIGESRDDKDKGEADGLTTHDSQGDEQQHKPVYYREISFLFGKDTISDLSDQPDKLDVYASLCIKRLYQEQRDESTELNDRAYLVVQDSQCLLKIHILARK